MAQPPLASAADFQRWMQYVEDRITRLEGRQSVIVGGWVLAQNADGDVVARHVPSGTEVVIAAAP